VKYESPVMRYVLNVKVFADMQTDKQIVGWTDRQAKNYMPPTF
jgi:hypothetical protein